MSYRLDPQWEDHEIEPDYSSSRWRGHLYKALISVGVLTAFGAAVLYAYSEGAPAADTAAKPGNVPLVKAETTPVKEKPEDPGGVKVPHRDADIYRKLDIDTAKTRKTETAPAPERKQAQVPPRPQTYEDILAPKTAGKAKARPTPRTEDRRVARAEPETRRVEVTPKAREPERTDAPEARGGKIAALPRLRGRLIQVADREPRDRNTHDRNARDRSSRDRNARDRQVAELSPRSGTQIRPKARPDDRAADRRRDTPRERTRDTDRTRDRVGIQTASAVGPYRVQLGAFRTPTKAHHEWKSLARRNKDILGSLRMVIERVNLGPKGVYYRLQAGPLKTAPAARGLCRTLGKRKVDCILVNG